MKLHHLLGTILLMTAVAELTHAAESQYIWTGKNSEWGNTANWLLNGSTPSSAPGAQSTAYTHTMLTNGTNSTGITNIGGLGSGGRYLKGIGIAGISNNPGSDAIPMFILNTNSGVYLRVGDGGVTVQAAETGYSTNFGIAQMRVAANQTWQVDAGLSFYVGRDAAVPQNGLYSLTTENDSAYTVTLAGPGATRIGSEVLQSNITDKITFIMDSGSGAPTFDLSDHEMANGITVKGAGALEGMSNYKGALSTDANTALTFRDTTAVAKTNWNMGTGTTYALENATLDLSAAGVDGAVTLKGNSGITGGMGTLTQTIEDNAHVTYTDRTVSDTQITALGNNVTITLNNATLNFTKDIPTFNLVVKGDCAMSGNGSFRGTITYEEGATLTLSDGITLPTQSMTLTAANITQLDGVPQAESAAIELSTPYAEEYKVILNEAFINTLNSWTGQHVFTVQFPANFSGAVTLTEVPDCVTSWEYDAASHALQLNTDVAALPAMPSGVSGSKPNIIFVLVDDMGWGDLEQNWSDQDKNGRTVTRSNSFATPQLNTMAQEGTQLRRHYTAAPVCAPARASLLLGVHQGHARVVRNNTFDQPIENSHTLASVLKGAGYTTAIIGKWGIGGGGQSGKDAVARPHERGFDYFYGIMAHLGGHFHYMTHSNITNATYQQHCRIFEYNTDNANQPAWDNSVVNAKVPETAYSTDLFGARAKQ